MIWALDIETTGLDSFKDRILSIGVWSPEYCNCFKTVSEFKSWLESLNEQPQFIMHRGSFDTGFIRRQGLDLRDYWAFDTHSMASILNPRPELTKGQKSELGLENLNIQLLKGQVYKLDRTNMASYSWEKLSKYNLDDCEITYKLWVKIIELLHHQTGDKGINFIFEWLMPATKLCHELEYEGIYVDEPGIMRYQAEVSAKRDVVLLELLKVTEGARRYYREIKLTELTNSYKVMLEAALSKQPKDPLKTKEKYEQLASKAKEKIKEFNFSSPKQLNWLLKDYYGLDLWNDREEKETTNEAKLKELDHPVASKLIEFREMDKLFTTCIPALVDNRDGDGFLRASFSIGGARTGRLSSSGPNLQQIPRGQIRSYLKADPRRAVTLATIDYSQIEVRILAEAAKERKLIEAFKEKIDIYSVLAEEILQTGTPLKEFKEKHLKERNTFKTVALSILYGTGAAKLQEVFRKELGKDKSILECRTIIENFRGSFADIKDYKDKLERKLSNRRINYNLLGRPFSIASNDDLYMKGMNTMVQGSASDLVIYSATKVTEALTNAGIDHTIRLLVHDEQVWEIPEDNAKHIVETIIIPTMTTAVTKQLSIETPLTVEYSISRQWEKP